MAGGRVQDANHRFQHSATSRAEKKLSEVMGAGRDLVRVPSLSIHQNDARGSAKRLLWGDAVDKRKGGGQGESREQEVASNVHRVTTRQLSYEWQRSGVWGR